MHNILLLGAPGSGKGTQAKQIEAEYDLVKIDTGSLIRAAIKEGTELGVKAKEYVDAGQLLPDELVNNIVLLAAMTAQQLGKGLLLDGYPRKISQAEALKAAGIELTDVLLIDVPQEKLLNRIVGRRLCSNKDCGAVYHIDYKPTQEDGHCDVCGSKTMQRNDDKEDLVKARLEAYQNETFPLIEYYQPANILHNINGDQDVKLVFAEIEKALA